MRTSSSLSAVGRRRRHPRGPQKADAAVAAAAGTAVVVAAVAVTVANAVAAGVGFGSPLFFHFTARQGLSVLRLRARADEGGAKSCNYQGVLHQLWIEIALGELRRSRGGRRSCSPSSSPPPSSDEESESSGTPAPTHFGHEPVNLKVILYNASPPASPTPGRQGPRTTPNSANYRVSQFSV